MSASSHGTQLDTRLGPDNEVVGFIRGVIRPSRLERTLDPVHHKTHTPIRLMCTLQDWEATGEKPQRHWEIMAAVR